MSVFNLIRVPVSKEKRRFIQDGFNLDLAYITPSVIAMGYPAGGFESTYRNPRSNVVRFLNTKHPGAYKVYNLCSERTYSNDVFEGVVCRFPFDDHQPPTLIQMRDCCQNVQQWLRQKENNVVVFHCKAGKGRTGVMICACLLCDPANGGADAIIKFYGDKRTYDGRGITIPSQIRFVHYYQAVHYNGDLEQHLSDGYPLRLLSVKIETSHFTYHNFCFEVFSDGQSLFKSGYFNTSWEDDGSTQSGLPLTFDHNVKFQMQYRHVIRKKRFRFWFNTFMILHCEKVTQNDFVGYCSTINTASFIEQTRSRSVPPVKENDHIYELRLPKDALDLSKGQKKKFPDDLVIACVLQHSAKPNDPAAPNVPPPIGVTNADIAEESKYTSASRTERLPSKTSDLGSSSSMSQKSSQGLRFTSLQLDPTTTNSVDFGDRKGNNKTSLVNYDFKNECNDRITSFRRQGESSSHLKLNRIKC